MSAINAHIRGKKMPVQASTVRGGDGGELQGQVRVEENPIAITGSWLKVASVHDEDWREGEFLADPERFISTLRQRRNVKADLFTFSEKPTDPRPRYPYQYVWDSVAGIPNLTFNDWWTNRVSSDLRKDVRRSAKRGVEIRSVPFNDALVLGIMGIYNETPVRQGRKFRHYNESFADVKRENSTYLDRSEFLGAFHGEELVGFLKIVYVDRMARMMQIIAKDAYRGSRPMNALIAKAVECADTAGSVLLTYGKFVYSQGVDSVTAFKTRNGFENIAVPQYFIPLTAKGRLAMLLHLHRGLESWVPRPVRKVLKRTRLWLYERVHAGAHPQIETPTVE
jgi:hypothetical protein